DSCRSQGMFDDEDDWKDWEICITPAAIPRYLDYSGSSLHPLIEVHVTYDQLPRVPLSNYENLYYTSSQAIGCERKIDPINLKPGSAEIIKLMAVEGDQTYAAANAFLRAYLDFSLRSCMTKYIQVPYGFFDTMVMAFCNQGMHRHKEGGEPGL